MNSCHILLQWQQLVSSDIEFVSGFKGRSHDALLGFNCKMDLIDRSQYFIDFADCSLEGCQMLQPK